MKSSCKSIPSCTSQTKEYKNIVLWRCYGAKNAVKMHPSARYDYVTFIMLPISVALTFIKTQTTACQVYSNLLLCRPSQAFSISQTLSIGQTFSIGQTLSIGHALSIGHNLPIGQTLSIGQTLPISQTISIRSILSIGNHLPIGNILLIDQTLSI